MADKDLGDVLGQTTLTLPVREASARKKVESIQEDTTPVEYIDPIPKAAPPKPKEKGTSAGEIYKSDIQASVDALEAGRKAQLKLDSEKAVDEAERLAAKAYKLSKSSAQQKKEILDDPARAEYKEALSEKAKPFIPHEENANDLMMLFGLLNVVGFAIGSGGKEYAQAAMSAMNGMLEGHQKGRDDLYKKEKSIFETNQKQLDSRIKQLLAFMQDNELLTGMDKTARDQAIESEFLQTGATFMLNYYRQKGAQPTIELLEQAVKTSSEVSKLTRAEVVRAEDQAREDVQKADERKFRLNVAAQQEEKARARAREERLFQISVKEQELAAAEDRDRRNKDFESAMAVEKNKVELAMQKENHKHAEAQSDRVINHAQAIEVERILAQKARDSQYASDRAQDKTEQAARDRATEAFRAEEQKARITAERLRLEHQKADDAHKVRMENFEKQRIELEGRRVAAAEAKASGSGSDTASDVKNFLGVNFGSGKQADVKNDQAAAAANTMAEALALSNVVRKNPDVVGRVGQAKGLIDRYVKSLDSNGKETESTPTEGSVKNKAEQDALLFSKRYASYLIRYEQALAGSAKGFTVAFMKRFNDLMQQNQFNPEGFDGLMKEQIREIAAKSAVLSTKITPENLMRLGVAQTRDPDAIEALGRMQSGGAAPSSGAAGGTRPAGAPAEAKQAADGKYYSKDPQTGKYIRWD
jgi:hypothetical protein